MFLFILESIGTSELMLIAVVALIIFGPRKLPQMVKTIGKTMGEFRNATTEFKTTWEKEADLDSIKKELDPENYIVPPKTIEPVKAIKAEPSIAVNTPAVSALNPQIKQLSEAEAREIFANSAIPPAAQTEDTSVQHKSDDSNTSKSDWL